MKRAMIYDLDSQPVSVREWTVIPNMRLLRNRSMKHNDKS